MRPHRTALAALLAALALPAGLPAQEAAPRLEPGDRIRFLAPGLHPDLVESDLLRFDPDTLRALSLEPSGSLYVVPLREIERIELRMEESHAGEGFLIGAGAGLVASALFLAAFCNEGDSPCDLDDHLRAAAIITPAPALLGTLIGSMTKSVRWVPVEVGR